MMRLQTTSHASRFLHNTAQYRGKHVVDLVIFLDEALEESSKEIKRRKNLTNIDPACVECL